MGFRSKTILWKNTALIRWIFTYGPAVWYPALTKECKRTNRNMTQRTANSDTNETIQSCSTSAPSAFLHLLPSDIHINYFLWCTAIKVRESQVAGIYYLQNYRHLQRTGRNARPTMYCKVSMPHFYRQITD